MSNVQEINKSSFITTMIVARNEEKYIYQCLNSLLNQDYPKESYEIIFVDGASKDKTVDVALATFEEFKATNRNIPSFRIFNNPKGLLASGWNIAIQQSKGDFLVRIDAHSFVKSDFLKSNIDTMNEVQDASCVGGSMITISDTITGEIIKQALSNPFGVGGSKFRYSKKKGYVDTVAYGLYKKSVFEDVGLFNEKLIRTQDNDLHRRMRIKGMKFYLNPQIESYYYARNTFYKLAKQQFSNGKWTMINFLLRPGRMSLRHFVPLFFVLFLLSFAILGYFIPVCFDIFIFILSLYAILALLFAFKYSRKFTFVLPFVFALMHISYGLGSIYGLGFYYLKFSDK